MAVSVAPARAPRVTWFDDPCTMTTTKTAQAVAPALMPMMSGLARGVRAMRCRTAPDRPKQAPTRRPTRRRRRRSSEVRQLAPADEGDEERRPDERGDDSDLRLAGPGDHAADDVGTEQQRRRQHEGPRQDPAVVGPADR